MNNLGHTNIAYDIQSAVDDKHCLVAHFSVENISDVHLLSQTAKSAKTEMEVEKLEILADKGYDYSADLQKCVDAKITTYVAYPDQDYKTKEAGGNELRICNASQVDFMGNASFHRRYDCEYKNTDHEQQIENNGRRPIDLFAQKTAEVFFVQTFGNET